MLDLADKLWRGEAPITEHHPFATPVELADVADGIAFVSAFANVTALKSDEGLILIDTSSAFTAGAVHERVRSWSPDRVQIAVFTHGHIDHVFGLGPFEAEGTRAHVVAHEAVAARFDRYRLTPGYNTAANRRQFRVAGLEWPTEYRYPDEVYRDSMTLTFGGRHAELHHARGETDDATWVWILDAKVLCTGDFFIWASPNAGNPQKAQRYPDEWAVALRQMASLGAETLLPGHGLPITGTDRVAQTLDDAATLLESLVRQTLDAMNAGATLDDVLHTVRAPAELLELPYLRPIYDEPEFVVRNVWRLYGGWYDGSPANLKPAPGDSLAREIAALAGDAQAIAKRALVLAHEGSFRLACHLAETAARAAPGDAGIQRTYAEVLERRSDAETSLMAKGIFGSAAAEARTRADESGEP